MRHHTINPSERAFDIAEGIAEKAYRKNDGKMSYEVFKAIVLSVAEEVLKEMYYKGRYQAPRKQ
jgi:hypothetical protein